MRSWKKDSPLSTPPTGAGGERSPRHAATIARFNEFARQGEDPDFGRGRNAYNKHQGDADHRPNPCLAANGHKGHLRQSFKALIVRAWFFRAARRGVTLAA